jgi:hypothetical protein
VKFLPLAKEKAVDRRGKVQTYTSVPIVEIELATEKENYSFIERISRPDNTKIAIFPSKEF